MNRKLIAAVDIWYVLYETAAHFNMDFAHNYWTWLKDRHPHYHLGGGLCSKTIVLIFDETHDLPAVDSPLRQPVEWLIEHFNLCREGQPFILRK